MLPEMTVVVEEGEEEVGEKAVGARPEAPGGIVDDGAPPWPAHAGAADDRGGSEAAEDVEE